MDDSKFTLEGLSEGPFSPGKTRFSTYLPLLLLLSRLDPPKTIALCLKYSFFLFFFLVCFKRKIELLDFNVCSILFIDAAM